MTLRQITFHKILNEVIRPLKKHGKGWNVLIVDRSAMRIISATCRMSDLMSEGITLVEDLTRKRQPFPTMDAIYLITPTMASIQHLINDFTKRRQYKYAHIFFTESCPDHLLKSIPKAVTKHIQTCKDLGIAYLPQESQVFTLDSPDNLFLYYNSTENSAHRASLERIAEQIATVCATLGEYPALRHRAVQERNMELLHLVEKKLEAYKADSPHGLGEGAEKARSQLIIIDRAFDGVSPLLHELTLQALVHDIFPMEGDIYRCPPDDKGKVKEVMLNEGDDLWVEHRHHHVADASQEIVKAILRFAETHKGMKADNASAANVKDLTAKIKKMPQYQKEGESLSFLSNLVSACMAQYRERLEQLCAVEQDLATGEDASGEKVRDPIRLMQPLLTSQKVSAQERLRLVLLHIMKQNGIPQSSLDSLLQHANLLEPDHKETILNAEYLGLNVTTDSLQTTGNPMKRRPQHSNAVVYTSSRWIPVIKDIMEDAIEDRLDSRQFPFLSGGKAGPRIATSARRGREKNGFGSLPRTGPRLIIFIVGGMTYSEMRAAYEVTKERRSWEVIIGSDTILTPEAYLESLRDLSKAPEDRPKRQRGVSTVTTVESTVEEVQEDVGGERQKVGCFACFR